MTTNTPSFKAVTWKDVRQEVSQVNPQLAKLIDDISPNNEHILYRVQYPFGELIFEEGILKLPDATGKFVPFNQSSNIPNKVKKHLDYRAVPLALMLKNSSEVFTKLRDRVIPLTIHSAGMLFGAWELFDPKCSYFIRQTWNVSAGSRSMLILPKTSDHLGYNRLKREFNLKTQKPTNSKEQWQMCREIINHECFPCQWQAEVLLFSDPWCKEIQQNKSWNNLKNYLTDGAWMNSMYWRHLVMLNIFWDHFAQKLTDLNLKRNSYALEFLKNIVAVGCGALPCFCADNSDASAPIQALQNIFIEIYQIPYHPTILTPVHLSMDKKNIGYLSIAEPILLEGIPKSREINNVMQTTRDVKNLLDHFIDEVLNGKLDVKNTIIYTLIKKARFNFTHSRYDLKSDIVLTDDLHKIDPALIEMPSKYKKYKPAEFCKNSSFLNGCIQVLFD